MRLQEDESDHFLWRPETEEDLAVAQEILDYLSQCQERRTLRTLLADHPLSWKCMYILVDTSSPQDTIPKERGILLGPSPLQENRDSVSDYGDLDVSYDAMCTEILGRFPGFQGDLEDPDGIRAFVLDALGLPEDFM